MSGSNGGDQLDWKFVQSFGDDNSSDGQHTASNSRGHAHSVSQLPASLLPSLPSSAC